MPIPIKIQNIREQNRKKGQKNIKSFITDDIENSSCHSHDPIKQEWASREQVKIAWFIFLTQYGLCKTVAFYTTNQVL